MNATASPSTSSAGSTLGDRLKAARTAKDLSVRALAGKVGVDHSFIVKLESGAKSGMTDDKAKKLAAKLDVSTEWLLTGVGLAAASVTDAGRRMQASPPANVVRNEAAPEGGPVRLIAYADLIASPLNPRKRFDDERLAELAGNIASQGLLQNLVARPHPKEPGKYELAAGERRYRALGLLIADGRWPRDRPIPVQVRDLTDYQMLFLGMGENVQRETMHPLEEGAGFSELLARSDDRAEATRQLAVAFGKTPRWVQLRVALEEKLAPVVKAAFMDNKIGLEEARAFTLGDQKTQAAFLKSRGVDRVNTDWIRRSMAETLIPVSAAHFPEADYKGEIRDDGGARYFADVPQFLELQSAAIERTIEKLKTKWAFVERVDHFPEWEHTKSADRKKAGAFVSVSSHSHVVKVFAGYLRRPEPKAAAKTAKRGGEADATPWTLPFLAECKRRKTTALQSAIVSSEPIVAIRLACLGLIAGGEGEAVKLSGCHNGQMNGAISAKVAAILKRLAPKLGAVMDEAASRFGDCPLALDGQGRLSSVKLWHALGELSDEETVELFGALVASRVGSFNGYRPEPHDDELAVAIAETLGVTHGTMPEGEGPFVPDDDFLKGYRKPGLIAAALASGTYAEGSKLADLPAGKIRAAMIASTTIDPAWLPDELRFKAKESEADDEDLDEDESDEEAGR